MALKTPCSESSESRHTHVGGALRTKAASSARISPHGSERVFSATGTRWLLVAICVGVSSFAMTPTWAQKPAVIVPPLETAAAEPPLITPAPQPHIAAPSERTTTTAEPTDQASGLHDPSNPTATPAPPPGQPPRVIYWAPPARLDLKERHSVRLAHRWVEHRGMPVADADGVVRWTYGQTMPRVVCAPMHLCDIALQSGEIVTGVSLGDKTQWVATPQTSGSPPNLITHIQVRPLDAGLVTNMIVTTSRRAYSIKLISDQYNYVPMTAFNYPDDAAAQWTSYQQQVGFQGGGQAVPGGGLVSYVISGDDPPWRPLQVYSDGAKTYVEFPASNAYTSAPVLEEWKSGCGLCVFRSPTYAVLNYRKISLPNGAIYYIADGVYDHLALISGVGNSQTIVRLDRPGG